MRTRCTPQARRDAVLAGQRDEDLTTTTSEPHGTPPRDLVKLELRARPVATIRFKGRNLGRTPLVIQVARSTQPLPIEATFTEQKLNALTGQKKVEIYKQTLTVTPDDHQSVDFDIKAAAKQPDTGR